MFLQFFTKRFFYFDKKQVKSANSHVEQNDKTGRYKVGNRGVIELEDKKAKQILKRYPHECELWGKDAVSKKSPVKGKNAKPSVDKNREL